MPFWRRRLGWNSLGTLAFAAVSTWAIVSIALHLGGIQRVRMLGVSIGVTNSIRSLWIGIAATALLLAQHWQQRTWRFACCLILGLFGVLAGSILARSASPAWPIGDGAIIELYTRYASEGIQRLGPYSQFGWNHPGPMMFYLLAPFYVLGGRETASLAIGALTVNVASVAAIAWVLIRRTQGSMPLGVVAVSGIMLIYVMRVPSLLTSAWNPHLVVLPLAALLCVAAAVTRGDVRLLPLTVLLASFIVQTHAALVPATGALLLLAFVAVVGRAIKQAKWDLDSSRAVNWSLWVLVVVWALPLAEQLMNQPGNMTRLAEFFFGENPATQPFNHAMTASSKMFWGVLDSNFYLAQGWLFVTGNVRWPVVMSLIVAVALPITVRRAWSKGSVYHACLGLTCLVAGAVAFWSALRIDRQIGDYQIFWFSVVGALSLAALLAAIPLKLWLSEGMRIAEVGAPIVLVIATATIGLEQIVNRREAPIVGQNRAVKVLTEQLLASYRTEFNRPLFQSDAMSWGVVAGVALQFVRAGVPFAVEPGLVLLLGEQLAPTGNEDVILTFSERTLHGNLAARPGNSTVASHGEFFVDGIKVVR